MTKPIRNFREQHNAKMARIKKKAKATFAALQNPPPKPASPFREGSHISLGYEREYVSTCCGAPTKQRKNKVICQTCFYPTATKLLITRANLVPAYGRRPITAAQVLDWFYRGWDYKISPQGSYTSIRDCAPNAILQIRYGKRLHKVLCHQVNPEQFAALQNQA